MNILDVIWPLLFPILGGIIAVIHILWKHHHGVKALETFLMWQLGIGLGLGLVYGGFGHLVFPDQVAESIGWPTGSPFQREVGIWDFSIGVVGLLCLKFKNGFWDATVIGAGLFYFGAGLGHVYELVAHGNTAPNNAGPVMYVDLLYPIFLAVLLIVYHRKMKEKLPV